MKAKAISTTKKFALVLRDAKTFKYKKFLLLKYSTVLNVGFLGFLVGKNYGGAVQRNKLKRLCREEFKKICGKQTISIIIKPLQQGLGGTVVRRAFSEFKDSIIK